MLNRTRAGNGGLIGDFKTVIQHTEELLKATADQTGEKITAVRSRAADNLREARRKLNELEGGIVGHTKTAAKKTDEAVHQKPWQSMAIAAAASFILGMLTTHQHKKNPKQ